MKQFHCHQKVDAAANLSEGYAQFLERLSLSHSDCRLDALIFEWVCVYMTSEQNFGDVLDGDMMYLF